MLWTTLGNDTEPNCAVAACGHAIQLWTGTAPTQDAIELSNNRFSGSDDLVKPLWGWFWRGIDGNRLGGFARIQKSEIDSAIARFGCAYVGLNSFEGVGPHVVLQIPGASVSWGKEYPVATDVSEAFAIAPKWHPILAYWAVKNNKMWWLAILPVLPILWNII